MASRGLFVASSRFARVLNRPFSSSVGRFVNLSDRSNDTAAEYRKYQIEKPLNPHMTNSTSTITNEMPSAGEDAAPPELITHIDPNFKPQDALPENTERMTGGTQKSGGAQKSPGTQKAASTQKAAGTPKAASESGAGKELEVGELEGASFRVEPNRRTGEDLNTLRARLLYQSRKRGTLESDLLLSTFADANLGSMSHQQLLQYDIFMDENDWDIYYWATQEAPDTVSTGQDKGALTDTPARPQVTGEWAQTVGTFKPAYRPVPSRWNKSEILAMLRDHVVARSAGGVSKGPSSVQGKGLNQSINGAGGGGLGFMPPVRNFDT